VLEKEELARRYARERGLDELQQREEEEVGEEGAAESPVSPTGTTLPQYSSPSSRGVGRSATVLKRERAEEVRSTAFANEKSGRAVEEVRRLVNEEMIQQVEDDRAEGKEWEARRGDRDEERGVRARETLLRKRVEELSIREVEEVNGKGKGKRREERERGTEKLALVEGRGDLSRPFSSDRPAQSIESPASFPSLLPPPPPPTTSSFFRTLPASAAAPPFLPQPSSSLPPTRPTFLSHSQTAPPSSSFPLLPVTLPRPETTRHSSLQPTSLYSGDRADSLYGAGERFIPTPSPFEPSGSRMGVRHSSMGPAASFYSPGLASVVRFPLFLLLFRLPSMLTLLCLFLVDEQRLRPHRRPPLSTLPLYKLEQLFRPFLSR
jgi:hypothetical protein